MQKFVRYYARPRFLRHSGPKGRGPSLNKSSTNSNSSTSSSSNADAYPPYKFGPYPSLNLPDEKSRNGVNNLIDKITDFNELKIVPQLREALINEIKYNTVLRSQNYVSPTKKIKSTNELNGLIIRPTPVQTAAIKIINGNKSEFFNVYTIAAETGSGKTWAYLAPLLQSLLTAEPSNSGSNAGIKSVILLPTHELVDQVFNTVSNVAPSLNLNIIKWDTDSNYKNFIELFKKGIDIMVTTPGKLSSLSKYPSISSPRMIFSKISFTVVDEADTLMDPSFIDETYHILKNMNNLSNLIFTSATVPSKFNKTISHIYPKITSISTPNLHKLPKSIEFRLINASVAPYKGSKIKALAQALYAIHCDGTEQGFIKRVVVFVNKKEDVNGVVEKLKTFGHNVKGITSDDDVQIRKDIVNEFSSAPEPSTNDNNRLKVLVTTDLLSRGLNFNGIRNIILLDVPSNSSDLVHRAGRTGRMNQSGRVFMIINDSDKGHVKGLPKVLRNNRRLG